MRPKTINRVWLRNHEACEEAIEILGNRKIEPIELLKKMKKRFIDTHDSIMLGWILWLSDELFTWKQCSCFWFDFLIGDQHRDCRDLIGEKEDTEEFLDPKEYLPIINEAIKILEVK